MQLLKVKQDLGLITEEELEMLEREKKKKKP